MLKKHPNSRGLRSPKVRATTKAERRHRRNAWRRQREFIVFCVWSFGILLLAALLLILVTDVEIASNGDPYSQGRGYSALEQ
ncbi:MAG: hypothetical protein AAFU85_22035 [Planctomycetota bacterium]